MDEVINQLKTWQLHPVVNHFTIALLTVALLTDLVASIFSSRVWMRYMALTLTLLGAATAALSWVTGGWEADRLDEYLRNLQGPAKAVFSQHAQWGEILLYVFVVLAVWRILVQSTGFFASTRPLYLLAMIVAVIFAYVQGWRGGKLVFEFGVGTQLNASTPFPTPSANATAAASPSSIPTVYVPAAPSPSASASPSAS